jgi:hypothetical protein
MLQVTMRIGSILTDQLKLHTKRWDEWTTCFEINTQLPDSPYVGFSALTGEVSDTHEWVDDCNKHTDAQYRVHFYLECNAQPWCSRRAITLFG